MTHDNDLRDWACAALAALFDRVPDQLDPPPAGAGRLADAARELARAFEAAARPETEADQVRLFINAPGGVPAPPYASWYLDGEIAGPAARYAAAAYAQEGLTMSEDAGEPPDALGAELEFLLFLGHQERAAGARRQFIAGHFSRWIPPFIAAMRSASPGPVYAAAATLLEEWLSDAQE